MIQDRRVVITGIGPVTSVGIGKKALFDSVIDFKPRIEPIPKHYEERYSFRSKHFVRLPQLTLAQHGIPDKYENILAYEDRMALVAAKLAIEDAAIPLRPDGPRFEAKDLSECAVILGTGFSGLKPAFESYVTHDLSSTKSGQKHQGHYHRMVIPKTMASSVAAWLSIMFGSTGESFAITASCASGTIAIGEAFRRIKNGNTAVALTGGVENLHDNIGAIMRGFDTLGTLEQSSDGVPLPFSERRSGFLFAEGGACVLVLEELARARARNAPIYAEILDYQASSDAHNIVQVEPSGTEIKKILNTLSNHRQIDYFNAHGTATQVGDRVEAEVIVDVFGKRAKQPLVNSTKMILGHTIGASGAIEAGVTAMSIKNSKVHGNPVPDPMTTVNLVLESVPLDINYAISASYGFGGHNGALLLCKHDLG
ncbi:MAG: beta-ketoacyl-[acyl-carrier-protein] synthase family protein [Candidatus Latescibacterota bacterium]|nr:MAG: beta-ketoacyl-[acyl-carrier-protein] synthase family protein [Candidatus Latescibacterota bacterium]